MNKFVVIGVLILAFLASLLIGCAEKELTQEEIEQLVTDVLIANAEVDTCKFDMHTLTTFEEIGGSNPGQGIMEGSGTGFIDSANRRMQMTLDLDINVPEKDKQSISMETSIIGGWMYITMDIPEAGEKQMKMEMPEGMWDSQSQIDQQIELLRTAKKVNFLYDGYLDGTNCYVVEVVPSEDVLGRFLSEMEMPEMEGLEPAEINLANLIKEISFEQWIAKDSQLIMKSNTQVLIEMRPEDIGASEGDFEKVTMNQTLEMKFYDYNEVVSIELPDEVVE